MWTKKEPSLFYHEENVCASDLPGQRGDGFPKAPPVAAEMARCLQAMGGMGRGTYLAAVENAMKALDLRENPPPDGRGGHGLTYSDARRIRPDTRHVVLNHATRIFQALQPTRDTGRSCAGKGVAFLLDAAQAAGSLDLTSTPADVPVQPDELPVKTRAGHREASRYLRA